MGESAVGGKVQRLSLACKRINTYEDGEVDDKQC